MTDYMPGDADDLEVVDVAPPTLGPAVDPPDRQVTFAAIASRQKPVRPIVPAALRSKEQRRSLARWAASYGGHTAAYHLSRAPKYAAKTAWWAPVGAGRVIGRTVKWAMAEEGNWTLRQQAASRNDPDRWLQLDARRQRQASWRWPLVLAGSLVLLAAVVILASGLTPSWVRWAAAAGGVLVLARLGRPMDRPIIDRVSQVAQYRKLTAELVRRAVVACNVTGIKEGSQLVFPREITRDGPGYLAVVDLPYGVEATDVIDKKGKLASGLRLPLDQVWPESAPGHTGRLALWVGDEPASQMRQPPWPLLKGGQVDLFKPFPFATTARLTTVDAQIMFRNWLFGGVPGSGKTFAMRVLALAAALDPRAELRGYELKGSGDYDVLEPLCTEYGSGQDDETAERALHMLRWLRQECGRRAERVKHYARAGKAPENKATPELASLPDSGLHPLFCWIDECQELFSHEEYGKEAGKLAEAIIKLGRAYGVILMLGTQRPDRTSLPPGITANVNSRFCLAVMDQIANDMILGTSSYKNGYRATQFQPGDDAGWGWAVGLGKPAPMRSFYVDGPAAKRIVQRALELRRGAGTLPTEQPERVPAYNLLDDVRAVWAEGEEALWSELIVPRLAKLRPEVYGEWDVTAFGAAMKAAGVRTVSIHRKLDGAGQPHPEGKGWTRYGVKLDTLEGAVQRRSLGQ